jgi:L-ascorbate metabolism protein UlaG (beta-lactamase superfamily)
MRRSPSLTFAAALSLLLSAGCGHMLPGTSHCQEPPHDREKVELRYLGSGGIYLRWRDDAILVGPSFSNPNPLRARFLRVKPNEHRIDAALQGIEIQRVRAIFAGHSHYDHIGDIPIVGSKYVPNADIYVNAFGVRMLAGEPGLQGRVREIKVDDPIDVSPSIRVRAVVSGHAPQICRWQRFPCVYANGAMDADWTEPITKHRLAAMNGGQTLALVIELCDGDVVRYRIYYNDASADSPLGQTTGDFDLAILCIAQWNWVRDYPRDLLAVLKPRHVVISHWDNFFVAARQSARPVPLLTQGSIARFQRVIDTYVRADAGPVSPVCGVRQTHWTMPAPASTMLFNPR